MDAGMYLKAVHLTKDYPIGRRTKRALDDVSFQIGEGERIGIVGSNGAGKSTLLSILANYASATSGAVETNGKISAVLDIGTSVQPEMTGRENLVLGGELYGLSKKEIEEKLPEIIDFIDIGDYLDYPMKTYSSGMQARVAFGIITFVQPEILIIDEALGVGDVSFNAKSGQKILELCEQGKILILVSHILSTVNELTDRCLWMDKGRIVMDGPTREVTAAYAQAQRKRENAALLAEFQTRLEKANLSNDAVIHDIVLSCEGKLEPADTQPTLIFDLFDDIQMRIGLTAHTPLAHPDLEFRVENMDELLLLSTRYSHALPPMKPLSAGESRQVRLSLPQCGFGQGVYMLSCSLYDEEREIARKHQILRMENSRLANTLDQLYYTKTDASARMIRKGL